MVVGENGVLGTNAQLLVEEQTREELVNATIQFLHSVERTVLLMVPWAPKARVAMRPHAQLTEDLVTGTNGHHAPLSVAVEIKQGIGDATTLFLSLVDWNAKVISPNANAVIWIPVHHRVLHKLKHTKRCHPMLLTLIKL